MTLPPLHLQSIGSALVGFECHQACISFNGSWIAEDYGEHQANYCHFPA